MAAITKHGRFQIAFNVVPSLSLQNVDDQSSYFQSIELVKEHPAYIMVFLHHVVLQFDPSPVVRR